MNPKRLALLFLSALALQAFPCMAGAAGLESVEFDRVDGNTVHFKAPDGVKAPGALKTGLYELTYIGRLQGPSNHLPYFIFSGKTCEGCLEEKNLHIFRPEAGKPNTFVFPGKIVDPKTGALLHESRSFFGKCVHHKNDVFITFQRERIDRRSSLQPSVFVAEAEEFHLGESLIERHLPRVESLKPLVKKKICFEIDGRNRRMLTKPLDLHPRANPDDDKDEDEEDRSAEDAPEPAPGASAPPSAAAPASTH